MAIGSPANLFVDWPNREIFVQKEYMLLVQSFPNEIRELDTVTFHADLRDLEDDEEGIVYPTTHNFTGPVTVGGVDLAQVVEIINNYTVTFEENPPAGSPPCPVPYTVSLQGSNNNVSDRTNVNSVSIRTNNTAGLTYSKDIEDQSFTDARVWVDSINGVASAQFPAGTPATPTRTFDSALAIIVGRGLPERLHVINELIVRNGQSIEGYNIEGEHRTGAVVNLGNVPYGSPITIGLPGPIFGSPPLLPLSDGPTSNITTSITECTVLGRANGPLNLKSCEIGNLANYQGVMTDCQFLGKVTLAPFTPALAGGQVIGYPSNTGHDINLCYAGGVLTPEIDANHIEDLDLSIMKWGGDIRITNVSDPNSVVTIDLDTGRVVLDSSVTAGTITVRGVGTIEDNSGPGATVSTDGLVQSDAGARAFGGM